MAGTQWLPFGAEAEAEKARKVGDVLKAFQLYGQLKQGREEAEARRRQLDIEQAKVGVLQETGDREFLFDFYDRMGKVPPEHRERARDLTVRVLRNVGRDRLADAIAEAPAEAFPAYEWKAGTMEEAANYQTIKNLSSLFNDMAMYSQLQRYFPSLFGGGKEGGGKKEEKKKKNSRYYEVVPFPGGEEE